jgi:putative transcriptional regulator
MITTVNAPCLLVAMPSMIDNNFSQAVLLLAEHNEEGAIGFVLNRPSSVSLKAMISSVDREIPEAIPAWYGGPVDTTTAIILHNQPTTSSDSEIAPGINLSTAGKILDAMIEHGDAQLTATQTNYIQSDDHRPNTLLDEKTSTIHPYRFLVGYAGWGQGQLDEEIKSGAWLVCPLDRKLVFDTSWSDLWQICMDRIGITKQLAAKPISLQNQPYLN